MPSEAIRLYKGAIDRGNAPAMNKLAYMHKYGLGGDVDYSAAIKLYDDAISLGNAVAMTNRACMHFNGQGGRVNYLEAIRLYEDAINLGNADAMTNRAVMHQYGLGGPVDYPKAVRLYRQSSNRQSSTPDALEKLKAIESSTFLWFRLSRQEYQTVIYHCAAADKKLSLFLEANPTAIDIFLKDDFLKKEERDTILKELDKQFFLSNIACFTQSIIDTLDSLGASIDLPNFTTLQDKLPFTIEQEYLLPLIQHLSANFKIGADGACAVLRQEYHILHPPAPVTAVFSLEGQNSPAELTKTSSPAMRKDSPSNANVPTSSAWRLQQNSQTDLLANNKSSIFRPTHTKETELITLKEFAPSA